MANTSCWAGADQTLRGPALAAQVLVAAMFGVPDEDAVVPGAQELAELALSLIENGIDDLHIALHIISITEAGEHHRLGR